MSVRSDPRAVHAQGPVATATGPYALSVPAAIGASPDPRPDQPRQADLVVHGAELVVTMDDDRRELAGGWVAITDGLVSAVGSADRGPAGGHPTVLDADGCLVTPGLRQHPPPHLPEPHPGLLGRPLGGTLFDWLTTLYPLWARLDEEAAYVSAWVGLAELALGGCTTSTDHLYVHPRGGGDLIAAEIAAASELGHALPPDPRLDEPVGEGRRPAARLGGAGRRRDPGRLRAPGGRATTTARRAPWCGSRWPRARRSR